MSRTRFSTWPLRNLRALTLATVGVVAGAFLVPSTMAGSSQLEAATTTTATVTRHASCGGYSFVPWADTQSFGVWNDLRIGQGGFVCGLTLPQGATISAVRFMVYDDDANGAVQLCHVWRSQIDPPAQNGQLLTGKYSTSVASQPGFEIMADTLIDHAVVDNRHFAYRAFCYLTERQSTLGILGVTVKFTLPAA
jgi:hypothetical protein